MSTLQKIALDKAYKEAGHNAYFGNGFNAGVEWGKLNPWIDVLDKEPESSQQIFMCNEYNDYVGVYHNRKFCDFDFNELTGIQYWMPIPKKPSL